MDIITLSYIFWLIIILFIFVRIFQKDKDNNISTPETKDEPSFGFRPFRVRIRKTIPETKDDSSFDFRPYRVRNNFFNSSEKTLYEILNTQLGSKYLILSKVRVEDIIESMDSSYKYRNYIKSRHIDFILLNRENYKIAHGIELDGGYHNRHITQKGDDFKNQLFQYVGVPLHRIKVGTDFVKEIEALEL